MNQAMLMNQIKKLQNEMMKEKDAIDNTEFVGESSLVKATVMGTKEVVKVEINADSLDADDIEALQDMIVVAINQANQKVDEVTEKKMSKFGNIPGLF